MRCVNCGELIVQVGNSWLHQKHDGGPMTTACNMGPVATPPTSGTAAVDGR